MVFGQEMDQNPDHSVVLADIDDVIVMLSLIVLSIIFFTNSSWYYFTPYQNLLFEIKALPISEKN